MAKEFDEMMRMEMVKRINNSFSFTNFTGKFSEDENSYKIVIPIPGVNKEDIKIEIQDNNLVIKVEKKQEIEKKDERKDNVIYRYAKSYAGFYRSISLPKNAEIENIETEYKNGILNIVIPKKVKNKKMIRVG